MAGPVTTIIILDVYGMIVIVRGLKLTNCKTCNHLKGKHYEKVGCMLLETGILCKCARFKK